MHHFSELLYTRTCSKNPFRSLVLALRVFPVEL